MENYRLNLRKIHIRLRLLYLCKRYFFILVGLSIFFGIYYLQQSLLAKAAKSGDGRREFLLTEPSNRRIATTTSYSSSSTCSLTADLRGAHQKVIGYSLYGDFSNDHVYRKYLKPFTETLRSIPIRYPGWIVRIYHNLTSDDVESWKAIDKVLDLGANNVSRAHIDLCNATQIIKNRKLGDIFAMTWRWLPLLDDMVDILMSRDTDSPVFPRESDAVAEWLASNQTFHLMRDHPAHCRFFMGCCWGVKLGQDRSAIAAQAEKMLRENHSHKYNYDQKLLDRFYQPMAVKSMMAHDSYCCQDVQFPSQPFPSPRQNRMFVGWREVGKDGENLTDPCPEKCRPQNLTAGTFAAVDWTFC